MSLLNYFVHLPPERRWGFWFVRRHHYPLAGVREVFFCGATDYTCALDFSMPPLSLMLLGSLFNMHEGAT